jgi:hypothetical protein
MVPLSNVKASNTHRMAMTRYSIKAKFNNIRD